MRSVIALWVVAAAAGMPGSRATAGEGVEDGWPERVVGIESLRVVSRPRLATRQVAPRAGKRTVALAVHVDHEGRVVRMRVYQSSGMGRVDDAAMQMARQMRFEPHRVDGVAVPVTLALPITVPFSDRM